MRTSKSSYEYHRRRLGEDRLAWPRPLVRRAFEDLGGARGYRAVHALLARRGTRVSEKVVRRVMREEGLRVPYGRRRRPYGSYTGGAKAYPSCVVDCLDGMPVGWAASRRLVGYLVWYRESRPRQVLGRLPPMEYRMARGWGE